MVNSIPPDTESTPEQSDRSDAPVPAAEVSTTVSGSTFGISSQSSERIWGVTPDAIKRAKGRSEMPAVSALLYGDEDEAEVTL